MKPKEVLKHLKDYVLRSYISAVFSSAVNIAFLVYNVYLGIVYHLIWNATICCYYFLLALLRILIFWNEKKWKKNNPENIYKCRAGLFRLECWLLLLVDLVLVVPIILMVKSQRVVNIGMIPAIAIATYTTYKTVMAILNYKKTRSNENLSLYGLKIINLKDALVSILTLQNTMIMVFGDKDLMLTLCAYTSAGILGIMLIITILLIRKSRRFSIVM